MGIESLLVFIIIGAIAGWLAGLIVSGFGFGLIGNIIVGWLFPRIGFSLGGGILASIIYATIGAIILLVLVKVLKRA